MNSFILVVLLAFSGLVTGDLLLRNLLFAPMIPLGILLGARYGDRLHPSIFRRAVLLALLGLGVLYAVRGA